MLLWRLDPHCPYQNSRKSSSPIRLLLQLRRGGGWETCCHLDREAARPTECPVESFPHCNLHNSRVEGSISSRRLLACNFDRILERWNLTVLTRICKKSAISLLERSAH
jgi:hypothetical protein